jgi:aspartate kinase
VAARILSIISKAGVVVDTIIQNPSEAASTEASSTEAAGGRVQLADFSFTVPAGDYETTMELMRAAGQEIGAAGVVGDNNIAKVSIVGVGMRNHAGVATVMFQALAREGINLSMISTSEIKISCVIEKKYAELAVRALHDAFKLGEPLML